MTHSRESVRRAIAAINPAKMQRARDSFDSLVAGHKEPIGEEPTLAQLEEWDRNGGCEATDGCWVEVDGKCEHGHSSWMLYLRLV